MIKPVIILGIISTLLAGCASSSAELTPSYVSPASYQSYSCDQLAAEGRRVSAAAARAAGQQDKNKSNDAVLTGVAVVLFWPALFALNGDGATAQEVSRLRGEKEAIEIVSVQKNCNIQFQQ